MKLLPISSIIVPERQRKRVNSQLKSSLRQSILQRGLLHPIGVWYDPIDTTRDHPILVYGGRRLANIHSLSEEKIPIIFDGKPVPLGKIPTVEFVATALADVRSSELEENTEREDLSWQDKTRALAEIHELRKAENPQQSITDTARDLTSTGGIGDAKLFEGIRPLVTMATQIAPFLDDPEVEKAKSASDAFQIITRRQQRGAEAEIVRRRQSGGSHDDPFIVLCGEALNEMSKLPTGKVDLILTDPPYGVNAQEDNFSRRSSVSHNYQDNPVMVLDLLQKFLIEAFRVTKPKANLFMFLAPRHLQFIYAAAERAAWTPFPTPIVWDKMTPGIGPWQTEGFQRTYELFLFATKGPLGLYRPVPDILHFKRTPKNEKTHAAQKPSDLLEFLIDISTLPGDLVLDPFAGSFSTLIAAKAKSRRGIGIELDQNLVDAGLVALFGDPNV